MQYAVCRLLCRVASLQFTGFPCRYKNCVYNRQCVAGEPLRLGGYRVPVLLELRKQEGTLSEVDN